MDIVTLVGLVAATFTTISLFPQLVKSWRTRLKPTGDSALVTYSMLFCVGIFLWLVYGVYKVDAPMIVANSLSFLQGVVILVLQFRRPKLKTLA
jgi:MtN3 and saliva related transmembrane protein